MLAVSAFCQVRGGYCSLVLVTGARVSCLLIWYLLVLSVASRAVWMASQGIVTVCWLFHSLSNRWLAGRDNCLFAGHDTLLACLPVESLHRLSWSVFAWEACFSMAVPCVWGAFLLGHLKLPALGKLSILWTSFTAATMS